MDSSAPQTSSSASTEPITALASLRLPTFSSLDAPTWFKRVEVQFRIHRIRDDRKADHVLAALPEEVFSQIATLLDTDEDLDYKTLKQNLLDRFTPSAASRAAKIRSLSLQPLGEQKPSAAWTEIYALANLHPPVDMLREMWLSRLPSHIRAALPKASEDPIDVLARKADDLIDAHAAASHRVCLADSEDEAYADAATSRRFSRRQAPPPTTRTGDEKPPPFLCKYHRRYGAAARNCRKGCTWPKNL